MPPSTPRALSTGPIEDKDKSNDVAFSSVSILPVSVSLAGVASADGSAAMRDVVLSALGESELTGDRFESVDLGGSYSEVPVLAVPRPSSKLRPGGRGRGRGLLGAGRRELANTATLNIVGASVALTGAYWEDDPSPGEVSEVFVEGGNSQEAREAMAAGLRPLVSYLRRLKRALTCNCYCNCHHHVKIPRC